MSWCLLCVKEDVSVPSLVTFRMAPKFIFLHRVPFRSHASLNCRLLYSSFSLSVIIFRESLAAKYLGLMMKYSGWKFFSSDDFDRDALRALSALPADRLAGVGAALKTPRFAEWCGLC
jgi:hypothetical protein